MKTTFFKSAAVISGSSFGFSIFLYSLFCSVQSMRIVGHPFQKEFLSTFLNLFDFPSQSFLIIFGIVAIVISIFVYRMELKVSREQ